MLLFEKDFPNMAADRYEQNDQFFRKLFDDPDMMKQVMEKNKEYLKTNAIEVYQQALEDRIQ